MESIDDSRSLIPLLPIGRHHGYDDRPHGGGAYDDRPRGGSGYDDPLHGGRL